MSKAKIYYHDIGEYLTRDEKLSIISKAKSFANLPMEIIQPNEQGDWISMRNDAFDTYIPLAPEKKFDTLSKTFFNTFSLGVGTNRDSYIYNSYVYTISA